jgi:hypothetical protein
MGPFVGMVYNVIANSVGTLLDENDLNKLRGNEELGISRKSTVLR